MSKHGLQWARSDDGTLIAVGVGTALWTTTTTTTTTTTASTPSSSSVLASSVDGVSFDPTNTRLLVATADKTVLVLNPTDLTAAPLASWPLPKRAAHVASTTLDVSGTPTPAALVTLRNGYLVAYPLEGLSSPSSAGTPKPGTAPPHRVLTLHTASQILDVTLSHDGGLVLTADREAKIRVTRLPFGQVLQAVCLGHTGYVRSVTVLRPPMAHLAVSAGGDGTVRLWRFEDGTLLHTLTVMSAPARPATDSASSWKAMDCVLGLSESPVTSGLLAAIITNHAAVYTFQVKDDVVTSGPIIPVRAQPLALRFEADGTIVVVTTEPGFQCVTLDPDADAPAAPSWCGALGPELAKHADVLTPQPTLTPFAGDDAATWGAASHRAVATFAGDDKKKAGEGEGETGAGAGDGAGAGAGAGASMKS